MNMKNKLGYSVISIILIVVGVIWILTYNNQYNSPIRRYYKGMQNSNIKVYAKAFPEFMNVNRTQSNESLKEILSELEKEYGEKIRIKYKIISKEKYDDKSLESIKEYIKIRYNKNVSVTNGYCLQVEVVVKGNSDSNTDNTKMYVYKIDEKWYYMPYSPESVQRYLEQNNK